MNLYANLLTIYFNSEKYVNNARAFDELMANIIKKDRPTFIRKIEKSLVTFKKMSDTSDDFKNGKFTDASNMEIVHSNGAIACKYQNQKISKFNNDGKVEIEFHVNENFDLDGPFIKNIFDKDIKVKCTFKNGKLTENGIDINCTKGASSIKITTTSFSLISAEVEVNLDEKEVAGHFFVRIKNLCMNVKRFKYINYKIHPVIKKEEIVPDAFSVSILGKEMQ